MGAQALWAAFHHVLWCYLDPALMKHFALMQAIHDCQIAAHVTCRLTSPRSGSATTRKQTTGSSPSPARCLTQLGACDISDITALPCDSVAQAFTAYWKRLHGFGTCGMMTSHAVLQASSCVRCAFLLPASLLTHRTARSCCLTQSAHCTWILGCCFFNILTLFVGVLLLHRRIGN